MGIREQGKIETQNKIIRNTKRLLFENGFVKVSTKDISRASEVAQGSIFLHFHTKDNLLHKIISTELELLQSQIDDAVDSKNDRETFLRDFINVLSEHENMLSRVYKDIPYLSEDIKKTVESIEVGLKNALFENIRNHPITSLSIVDSFINIDAFIAQIKINLLEKDTYNDYNSILKQRRGKLVKLHRTLFE